MTRSASYTTLTDAALLPQLSRTARPLSEGDLDSLVRSDAVRLLVVRDADQNIVGTLALALFLMPTGMRAGMPPVSWAPERLVGIVRSGGKDAPPCQGDRTFGSRIRRSFGVRRSRSTVGVVGR